MNLSILSMQDNDYSTWPISATSDTQRNDDHFLVFNSGNIPLEHGVPGLWLMP